MKIVDGYCNFSCKKELETLMAKMANLSRYQPVLVDSITLSKDEQKLFDKRQEDYYLFEAGFLYLFSQSVYIEHILSVFNNLTYKQRSNFYAYYKSFNETAIKHGFLTEYSLLIKTMQKWTLAWYIKVIAMGLFFLFTYIVTSSFLIASYFFIILSYLSNINDKLNEIDISTMQTDLIIQKLNSDLINSDLAWANEKLVESGWINKNGKIVP